MGTSHYNKVSGENGVYIGKKGSEKQISNSSAELMQAGELLRLKTKKISITAPDDDSEIKTGVTLPSKAAVVDVLLDVTTKEETGTTKTIDVGTDSSDSGDANGFLNGVAVDAAGLVKGTLDYSGQTLGALLTEVSDDTNSVKVPEIDIASGGKEITYTAGSSDFDELEADIYIVYFELGA